MRTPTSLILIPATTMLILLAGCSSSSRKSDKQGDAGANNRRQGSITEEASTPTSEPAASESPSTPDGNEVADELHTPEKGSLERQGMMDALRAALDERRGDYYTPHRGNIIFVVNYLKAHNGWAWTYADPQSSDKSDSFGEYSGFLLHQQGGQWRVMKLPQMHTDPNDPENLDYPSRKDVVNIRRTYPNVPLDIFPKPR